MATNNPIELLVALGVNGEQSRTNIQNYLRELSKSLNVDVTIKTNNGNIDAFKNIEQGAKNAQKSVQDLGKATENVVNGKLNKNADVTFKGFRRATVEAKKELKGLQQAADKMMTPKIDVSQIQADLNVAKKELEKLKKVAEKAHDAYEGFVNPDSKNKKSKSKGLDFATYMRGINETDYFGNGNIKAPHDLKRSDGLTPGELRKQKYIADAEKNLVEATKKYNDKLETIEKLNAQLNNLQKQMQANLNKTLKVVNKPTETDNPNKWKSAKLVNRPTETTNTTQTPKTTTEKVDVNVGNVSKVNDELNKLDTSKANESLQKIIATIKTLNTESSEVITKLHKFQQANKEAFDTKAIGTYIGKLIEVKKHSEGLANIKVPKITEQAKPVVRTPVVTETPKVQSTTNTTTPKVDNVVPTGKVAEFQRELNKSIDSVEKLKALLESKGMKYTLSMSYDKKGVESINKVVTEVKNEFGEISKLTLTPKIDKNGLMSFQQSLQQVTNTDTHKLSENITKAQDELRKFARQGELSTKEYQKFSEAITKSKTNEELQKVVISFKSLNEGQTHSNKIANTLSNVTTQANELIYKLKEYQKVNSDAFDPKFITFYISQLEKLKKQNVTTTTGASKLGSDLGSLEKDINSYVALKTKYADTAHYLEVMRQKGHLTAKEFAKFSQDAKLAESTIALKALNTEIAHTVDKQINTDKFNKALKSVNEQFVKMQESGRHSKEELDKFQHSLSQIKTGELGKVNTLLEQMKERFDQLSNKAKLSNSIQKAQEELKAFARQGELSTTQYQKFADLISKSKTHEELQKVVTTFKSLNAQETHENKITNTLLNVYRQADELIKKLKQYQQSNKEAFDPKVIANYVSQLEQLQKRQPTTTSGAKTLGNDLGSLEKQINTHVELQLKYADTIRYLDVMKQKGKITAEQFAEFSSKAKLADSTIALKALNNEIAQTVKVQPDTNKIKAAYESIGSVVVDLEGKLKRLLQTQSINPNNSALQGITSQISAISNMKINSIADVTKLSEAISQVQKNITKLSSDASHMKKFDDAVMSANTQLVAMKESGRHSEKEIKKLQQALSGIKPGELAQVNDLLKTMKDRFDQMASKAKLADSITQAQEELKKFARQGELSTAQYQKFADLITKSKTADELQRVVAQFKSLNAQETHENKIINTLSNVYNQADELIKKLKQYQQSNKDAFDPKVVNAYIVKLEELQKRNVTTTSGAKNLGNDLSGIEKQVNAYTELQLKYADTTRYLSVMKQQGKITADQFAKFSNDAKLADSVIALKALNNEIAHTVKMQPNTEKIKAAYESVGASVADLEAKLKRVLQTYTISPNNKGLQGIQSSIREISNMKIESVNDVTKLGNLISATTKKIQELSNSASHMKKFDNAVKDANAQLEKMKTSGLLTEKEIYKLQQSLSRIKPGEIAHVNNLLDQMKKRYEELNKVATLENNVAAQRRALDSLMADLIKTKNVYSRSFSTEEATKLENKIKQIKTELNALNTSDSNANNQFKKMKTNIDELRNSVKLFHSESASASKSNMGVIDAFKVAMERFPITK